MNPWRCPRKHFFATPGITVILLKQAMSVTEETIVTMVETSNTAIKVYIMPHNAIFFYVFAFDVFTVFTQSPCRCAKMDLNVGGSAYRKNSFAMANTIVLIVCSDEIIVAVGFPYN